MKLKDALKLRAKPAKYRAEPTMVGGIRFASKREARHYQQLRLLALRGKIAYLETQVPFPCRVNGKHVCTYVADFVYEDPVRHVVDAKGVRTRLYRLKKKLVEALYGLKIEEV